MKNHRVTHRIFPLVFVLFLPMLVLGQISHSVFFTVSDFYFEKQDSFDVVRAKGLPMSTEVGAPMLPIRNVSLIVPTGMDVSSVTITKKVRRLLAATFASIRHNHQS